MRLCFAVPFAVARHMADVTRLAAIAVVAHAVTQAVSLGTHRSFLRSLMFIPNLFAPLIQNALLLLCGWNTFKVLETDRAEDDTHWLTFWFVYTLFAFARSIVDYVAFVIPFYNELTIGFTVYLAYLGGATHLYSTVLRPLLKEHEATIDGKLRAAGQLATEYGQKAKDAAQDALKKD